MLLESYQIKLFRSKCNANFKTLDCHVLLDQDVSGVLPYLNAHLGGDRYTIDPPSVTFRASGKLITVYGSKIAVNALRDAEEASKIIEWIQREINAVWDQRHTIEPSCQSAPDINLVEVLKHLPKTNCGQCGEATCMVFAVRVAEGAKIPAQCPEITPDAKEAIESYMARFDLSESL